MNQVFLLRGAEIVMSSERALIIDFRALHSLSSDILQSKSSRNKQVLVIKRKDKKIGWVLLLGR
jgi:hypothetical protein